MPEIGIGKKAAKNPNLNIAIKTVRPVISRMIRINCIYRDLIKYTILSPRIA